MALDQTMENAKPSKEIPSVKEEFQDLLEKDNAEQISEYTVVFGDGKVLISLEQFFMDFQIGKEIADVRVEDGIIQTRMRVKEIRRQGMSIGLVGQNQGEISLII